VSADAFMSTGGARHVVADRLTAFNRVTNTAARPFDWRFSRNGINRLVAGSPREPDELTA
jgi:hypothetical protein